MSGEKHIRFLPTFPYFQSSEGKHFPTERAPSRYIVITIQPYKKESVVEISLIDCIIRQFSGRFPIAFNLLYCYRYSSVYSYSNITPYAAYHIMIYRYPVNPLYRYRHSPVYPYFDITPYAAHHIMIYHYPANPLYCYHHISVYPYFDIMPYATHYIMIYHYLTVPIYCRLLSSGTCSG